MPDEANLNGWTTGKAVFAMVVIFISAAALIHWSEDIFPPIWEAAASWLD